MSITIRNIGPIEELSIPVPKHGGVVVLKGRNGKGKSQALAATESLIRGNGTALSHRDGSLKGEVNGFGARLTVARHTRRTGELDVVSLEGKLDVSQVVDPGIKEPGAADAKRIKALLGISGLKPDTQKFRRLFANEREWREVVDEKMIAADKVGDYVELAARIKRDLEKASRDAQTRADGLARTAAAKRESAKDVRVEDALPEELLHERYSEALKRHTSLTEQHAQAVLCREKREDAKRRLENASADYSGPTESEAAAQVVEWERLVEMASDNVRRAEQALIVAKEALREQNVELANWREKQSQAKRHNMTLIQCREALDAAGVEDVAPEKLAAAAVDVQEARAAIERGTLARRGVHALSEAKQLEESALAESALALRYREAAKATDDVLSELICTVGADLQVDGGRLVTETDRGKTYFSDLSAGERWRIALDIAVQALPEDGVLVIPQEAWEGLDGVNRRDIASFARERQVVIVTAEATKDEDDESSIHAEVV